jgi:cytosine/adenosine deaminase-related metal-dependent hydrolase
MLLRARIVLPICLPPIEDGAVRVSGNRIASVGRWADLREANPVDLGEVILLPGLVNAHCHLDYTGMAGKIPPPKSFPDWIKALLALKAHWSYTEYAQSWLDGATMLVKNGVTTVGDIESVPELLPDVWAATPLRIFSFMEMTGLKSRRAAEEILDQTVHKIDELAGRSVRNSCGLSPHAPYSTAPELLRRAGEVARRRHWRVATHVAESAPEFEMFMYRQGPLFQWLEDQRDMSDCGTGTPVQHLARTGLLGENFLAVHANYLWGNDARLLAQANARVVHCPRSHAYFDHHRFPVKQLAEAGVNICLGTDSLVSTKPVNQRERVELDLFEEMRVFEARSAQGQFEKILEMATRGGAQALGASGQIGELSPGALADLIALPYAGDVASVHEAVLHHENTVNASMIDGQWAIEP